MLATEAIIAIWFGFEVVDVEEYIYEFKFFFFYSEKSLKAIVLVLLVSVGIFYLAEKGASREEKIAGNWYAGHNKRKEGG